MRKWAACFLIAFYFLSTEVFAQRGPGRRDPFEVAQACHDAFQYDFQRQDCQKKARDADQVRGCGKFQYDFQKFECIEKAVAVRGGVAACYDGFQYDFQRFECIETPADGRKVVACTKGFQYDFQRFDCLKTQAGGAQAEYCIRTYQYDFQRFDCLKKSGPPFKAALKK